MEYLNPLSWLSSFGRTLESTLLCSCTSALSFSLHIALVFPGMSAFKRGTQPKGGKPRNLLSYTFPNKSKYTYKL